MSFDGDGYKEIAVATRYFGHPLVMMTISVPTFANILYGRDVCILPLLPFVTQSPALDS